MLFIILAINTPGKVFKLFKQIKKNKNKTFFYGISL